MLTVLNSKQRIPPWDEVDFLSRLNHSFSNATIYGQFALHLSINTKKKNNDNLPNSLVEREDYI